MRRGCSHQYLDLQHRTFHMFDGRIPKPDKITKTKDISKVVCEPQKMCIHSAYITRHHGTKYRGYHNRNFLSTGLSADFQALSNSSSENCNALLLALPAICILSSSSIPTTFRIASAYCSFVFPKNPTASSPCDGTTMSNFTPPES